VSYLSMELVLDVLRVVGFLYWVSIISTSDGVVGFSVIFCSSSQVFFFQIREWHFRAIFVIS